MLETKMNQLEKAIEKKEPLNKVRVLFLDYCKSYKQIRKPSHEQFKTYENIYYKYIHYLDGLKELKK